MTQATSPDRSSIAITGETNIIVYCGRLARLHKQVEVMQQKEKAMKEQVLAWMKANDCEQTLSTKWGKIIYSKGQRKYNFLGKAYEKAKITLKAVEERCKLSPNLHTLTEGLPFLKVQN